MAYSDKHLSRAISERKLNHVGEPRRMGVEIEFSDIEPDAAADVVCSLLGGTIDHQSPFEINVNSTELGDFKILLDSSEVRRVGREHSATDEPEPEPDSDKTNLKSLYLQALGSAASSVVPWEIVTPPIPLNQLHRLYPLVEKLRAAGATGTKSAPYYAFGVHLNPEANDLSPESIVNHLRSYFCLNDWIRQLEQPDFARRITPHINHFKEQYVLNVLDPEYQPTLEELIEDYITDNPTRNRDLDMLPMFAFLKPDLVSDRLSDQKINARPTFHYRLPNCDIDNPNWNIDISIELWMVVEELAIDHRLQRVCDEYRARLTGTLPVLSDGWVDRLGEILPSRVSKLAS